MKENENEDLGRDLFDPDEPELRADEPALEGYDMQDPGTRELDSIVREVMDSIDSQPEPESESEQASPGYQEYSDQYADSPEPQPEEEFASPARKNRPRRKKIKKKGTGLLGIPHFISGLILVVFVLFAGVTAARAMWLWADDLLALTKKDRVVTVTISDSDSMNDIAQKLGDAGLIRYPGLFGAYCKLTDSREKISSGEFQINEMYDYHALVSSMSSWSSDRTEVEVMIPEGYECRQIFELMEKNKVCTVEELEQAAMTMDLEDYWFLEDLDQEDRENPYCLEGFLFPDTYNFYMSDEPERVLHKFLSNFDNRFDEDMVALYESFGETYTGLLSRFGYSEEEIEDRKLSIRDVVNVASMLERETSGSGESAVIASVIYNRLTDPEMTYLQIDATIQYALGERKPELSLADLEIDSPYNTYKNPGLPVGPISNPGMNSLKAALQPADTNYYYYALDTDGTHHFSETFEDHQTFLNGLGEEG